MHDVCDAFVDDSWRLDGRKVIPLTLCVQEIVGRWHLVDARNQVLVHRVVGKGGVVRESVNRESVGIVLLRQQIFKSGGFFSALPRFLRRAGLFVGWRPIVAAFTYPWMIRA